ncbi:MAG: flippase-like domain-containing protein [Chloroherpetonaceae bacterium]|nr:flippase-like domain-containing protein [Chloroherpetonaceae bacterium]MDW8436515.1 lysylphosphatidylglycerol synthase domain-containing protein [Chloroherpetonaceae bacterium]
MKRYAIPLKILLSLALLWIVFSKLDANAVFQALVKIDGRGALVALLLVPASFFLETMKWKTLMARQEPSLSFLDALRSALIGTAGAIATPLHIGKYVAQMWFHADVPKARLLALVFLNGQILGAFTLLFGLPSLAIVFGLVGETALSWLFVALSLAATLLSLALILIPKSRLPIPDSLKFLLEYSPAEWAKATLYGFLRHAVSTVQFCLLINACLGEGAMPFGLALVAVSSIWLAKAVAPFFVGDLGLREATAAYFLGALGYSAEAGVAASLLIFTMNLLLPALVGLSAIPKLRFSTS